MWSLFCTIASFFILTALSQITPHPDNYSNPIIYSDFPDNDVFRGPDGVYYFSASSFHFSPGAPILKSYDLINWKFLGHSVPSLDFGDGYNMIGGTRYVGGIWPPVCVIARATKSDIGSASVMPGGTCYYDCGLLIDDDDTMYVVYGNTNISIAQLSPDGLQQVKTQYVFSGPEDMQGIEGNRLYKINGTYYILDDASSGTTFIWKSDNIWGPWKSKVILNDVGSPLPGGNINGQGSLVEAPDGQWYFMAFTWNFPMGRIPILTPIQWGSDGYPALITTFETSYPFPAPTSHELPWSFTGVDHFNGTALGPAWEWNFNPDSTKYKVDNGLTLITATVTDDLYLSRNTLTHRLYGPHPVGTAEVDFSNMADGDRCGLAAFQAASSWIEVHRIGEEYFVSMIYNSTQDPNNNWATTSKGSMEGRVKILKGKLWLRTEMNSMSNSDRLVTFSYSTTGSNFTTLGKPFAMSTSYQYFNGYRYGIFNFATKALGGSVKILTFKNE